MPTVELPDGTLVVHSAVLGLDIRLAHGEFHFVDPAASLALLTSREAYAARQVAERARQAAEQAAEARARAAEARIAELEAHLRALQVKP